jgi:hypothetical protein
VAEAVTAAVAHSGTPAPAKGAFTAEKRPLTPSDLISDAGAILRLGHSRSDTAMSSGIVWRRGRVKPSGGRNQLVPGDPRGEPASWRASQWQP